MPETPLPEDRPADDSLPQGSSGRRIAAILVVGGLFVWLFWDFLDRQVRWAIDQQADWGHTLVIPFIAGYIAWLLRARLTARPLRTTWIGLIPVLVGVGWYILCIMGPKPLHHHNLRAMGVAMTIAGLVLSFGGWRVFFVLLFPLAYLCLFGQTISDQFMSLVTQKMQDVTARGAYVVLALAQFDIELEGNTLQLWYQGELKPLNVAEACSGMRMLMAFLALGSYMAYTGLQTIWQRSLLIVAGIPTAIFVNILRVITLGLLSLIDADLAAGDFHSFIGLLWLVPAFAMFLGIMALIRRCSPRSVRDAPSFPEPTKPLRFDRRSSAAVVTVALLLVGSAAGFQAAVSNLNIHLRKEAVSLRESLDTIPLRLGDWSGTRGAKLSEEVIETLGTRQYFDASYVRGDRSIGVHVAYYTGFIDAVPHVPDRCLVAAGYEIFDGPGNVELEIRRRGWRLDGTESRDGSAYERVLVRDSVSGRAKPVRMPFGTPTIRQTVFTDSDRPGFRLMAGYFFIANNEFAAQPKDVKRLAFDPRVKAAYYCKVQFAATEDADVDESGFRRDVADLLDHLLPELMRCLPDWYEVEQTFGDAALD